MSIHTKRFFTSTGIIWICLFLTALVPLAIIAHGGEGLPAVANAQPVPWWQQVEQFQSLALKWIAALTAVTAALATFVGVVYTQYRSLKDRLDRVSDRADVAVASAASAVKATGLPTDMVSTNIASVTPKQ